MTRRASRIILEALTVAALVAGCSSSDDPSSTPTTTSTRAGSTTSTTSSPTTTAPPTTGDLKPTGPVLTQVEIPNTVGRADVPLAFTATFHPQAPGDYRFSFGADPVAEVVIPDADAVVLTDGQDTEVAGTIVGTGPGTGTGRLTVSTRRDGVEEASTVTLFLASSDGWTVIGTSSTSATQTKLLDTLLAQEVITQAEYERRLDALTGGT